MTAPLHARAAFTACALALELSHLAWEFFNGGIKAHHLLNRADLPAIWNGWGALLVPALAWMLSGRIQRRIQTPGMAHAGSPRLPVGVVLGFLGALVYGGALALAFETGHKAQPVIFFGIFVLSVFLPTYRAEYVLGFVFGMMFTFGAMLPSLIALVVATISGVWHFVVRGLWRLMRRGPQYLVVPWQSLPSMLRSKWKH